MLEFRIKSCGFERWVVERRYKLFFGLKKRWDIAIFPFATTYSSIENATKAILKNHPVGRLVIYEGKERVLHYKRDK